MATKSSDRVWFITGCSTGFGRELAEQVLERGERAVVTARDPASVADIVAGHDGRAIAVALDVTRADQIAAAVKAAEDAFGGIDVLVNNAGYGCLGSIEEIPEAEYRAMFETNLFGPIAMMRAVLPGMRARRRGHVINLSSVAGFKGFQSSSFYSGTKFALEGLSEAVAADLQPLGIAVTIVEPSGFRTDFAGRSVRSGSESIADYAATADAVAALKGSDGKQPGDPKRGAAAIIAAADEDSPPMRLLLGSGALHIARIRVDELKAQFERTADAATGSDFPQ